MTGRSRRRSMFLGLLALGLTLALTLGAGLAQEPEGESEPLAPVSVEGEVANKFSYQGMLREDGVLVNGTRHLAFRLYSNAACTTDVSIMIYKWEHDVSYGLFSVELAFDHSHFNGQELWLGVWVQGTLVACEEILPVPYAFSLRPGADIVGTVDHLLELDNTATAGDIDTLVVRNDSASGEAVEVDAEGNAVAAFAVNGIGVWGDSDFNHGVYGRAWTTAKAGVLAMGLDDGPDLILAGNANTGSGDNGVMTSDPEYSGSDILIKSNDAVRIALDNDMSGEDSDFEIVDKDNDVIFNVDESGDVTSGGPGIRAFPRPAYDSGWFAIAENSCQTKTHNLGENVDNYVVDFQMRKTGGLTPLGIHNRGLGVDLLGPTDGQGAHWRELTSSTIVTCRSYGDDSVEDVRIRIWMYP